METVQYRPRGVCSRAMEIDIEDGIVREFRCVGGCNGNLKGISNLVKDMPVDEVIRRLDGITCGFQSTPCPDQLGQALKEWKE